MTEEKKKELTEEQREKLRALAVKQLSQIDLYNLASPEMLKGYGELARYAEQLREATFESDEHRVAYEIMNRMRIGGAAITSQTITENANRMILEYIGMLKVSDVLTLTGYKGPTRYDGENDRYLTEIEDKKKVSQIVGTLYNYQANKAAERTLEMSNKELLGGLEKIMAIPKEGGSLEGVAKTD